MWVINLLIKFEDLILWLNYSCKWVNSLERNQSKFPNEQNALDCWLLWRLFEENTFLRQFSRLNIQLRGYCELHYWKFKCEEFEGASHFESLFLLVTRVSELVHWLRRNCVLNWTRLEFSTGNMRRSTSLRKTIVFKAVLPILFSSNN